MNFDCSASRGCLGSIEEPGLGGLVSERTEADEKHNERVTNMYSQTARASFEIYDGSAREYWYDYRYPTVWHYTRAHTHTHLRKNIFIVVVV